MSAARHVRCRLRLAKLGRSLAMSPALLIVLPLTSVTGSPASARTVASERACGWAVAPGGYLLSLAIHASTPDGTADWNEWRLATLHGAGGTGMFLWKQRTGALYLWRGVTVKDNGDGTGTITFTSPQLAADVRAAFAEPAASLVAEQWFQDLEAHAKDILVARIIVPDLEVLSVPDSPTRK